jgi:hypothetical protein
MLPLLLCLEIDQTTITDTITTVLFRCIHRGPENPCLRSSVQLASGYPIIRSIPPRSDSIAPFSRLSTAKLSPNPEKWVADL